MFTPRGRQLILHETRLVFFTAISSFGFGALYLIALSYLAPHSHDPSFIGEFVFDSRGIPEFLSALQIGLLMTLILREGSRLVVWLTTVAYNRIGPLFGFRPRHFWPIKPAAAGALSNLLGLAILLLAGPTVSDFPLAGVRDWARMIFLVLPDEYLGIALPLVLINVMAWIWGDEARWRPRSDGTGISA